MKNIAEKQRNATNKQQILQFLEKKGWTELIDSRWESKVKEEILTEFPDIDTKLLDYILNLILI